MCRYALISGCLSTVPAADAAPTDLFLTKGVAILAFLKGSDCRSVAHGDLKYISPVYIKGQAQGSAYFWLSSLFQFVTRRHPSSPVRFCATTLLTSSPRPFSTLSAPRLLKIGSFPFVEFPSRKIHRPSWTPRTEATTSSPFSRTPRPPVRILWKLCERIGQEGERRSMEQHGAASGDWDREEMLQVVEGMLWKGEERRSRVVQACLTRGETVCRQTADTIVFFSCQEGQQPNQAMVQGCRIGLQDPC